MFDINKLSEITAKDIRSLLVRKMEHVSINALLHDHPLFPDWIVSRNDFQMYYNEWGATNGAPNTLLVEEALRISPDSRRPGDLQIMYKWIKLSKILVHVRQDRLIDVCR